MEAWPGALCRALPDSCREQGAAWLGNSPACVPLCRAVGLSRGNKIFCLRGYMCILLRVCKFLYDPQSELNHCVFIAV